MRTTLSLILLTRLASPAAEADHPSQFTLLEYRNQVSDHLPVIARFRITADDD